MHARAPSIVAVALLASLSACEKSSPGKGAPASEAALWKLLPASSTVVFGGNYLKLQRFMTDSALGKATRAMGTSVSAGMKDWIDCFVGIQGVDVVGAVSIGARGGDMRMVMTGVSPAQITTCAGKAGFKVSPAPDGKFLSVDVPSPAGTHSQGYLQVAGGALYTRQGVALGGGAPAITPATRAELEADVAAAATASVTTNAALQALIAKADRSKTMWFAGSAAGTPIADKLGEVYGALDLDHGVAADVTAQVLDAQLASQAEQGIQQAKQSVDALPAEVRDVVRGLELSRAGDRLRLKLTITDAQLAGLLQRSGLAR